MSDPTTMSRPPAQPGRPEPRGPLEAIFSPRAVAVIGASEKAGSVGRSILWNLIGSPFGGTVYPVNPKRPNVLGIRSYPSIAAVPEPVDLAVVVTPAPTVPQVIGECADAGVKGAIIISAGFKEVGPEGAELERQVHGAGPPRQDAADRPQLPGRDESRARAQRHVRRRDGPARDRRVPQPERRPVHGDPRLEPAGQRRLQRVRLDRLDARRRLGRPDRLPGRRPRDEVHRDLHGDDRRRAGVPLGGARGGARPSRSS